MEKLALENRIALLKSRKRDNARIIRKLERRLSKFIETEVNAEEK